MKIWWGIFWFVWNAGCAVVFAGHGRIWLPLLNAFVAGGLLVALATMIVQGRERERAPK